MVRHTRQRMRWRLVASRAVAPSLKRRVQIADPFGEFLHELLHHSAARLDAVNQSHALSDEIGNKLACLRITFLGRALRGGERGFADQALQWHWQRAWAIRTLPRIGPRRAQLAGWFSGSAPRTHGVT